MHSTFDWNAEDTSSSWVVVFLSSRCPCSKGHESVLRDLRGRFGSQFQFLGIASNVDESEGELTEHFRGASLGFPIIHDRDQKLADRFGANRTPHVFVIRNGAVMYQGGVDNSHLASTATVNYLETVLNFQSRDQRPPIQEGRTLGCLIKRP